MTVVAVTKGHGPEAVLAALDVGLTDIGENYAQELLQKAERVAGAAPAAPRWHYLGAVQRRKVRSLAPLVSLWQGVSRLEEGAEIGRHIPGAEVLVEVDVTGTPGRGGVSLEAAPALVAALPSTGVVVRGLMIVAPAAAPAAGGDPALAAFKSVGALADELRLPVRSMGMSGDIEQAVQAGSTMVRVGEALFGPRPTGVPLAQ